MKESASILSSDEQGLAAAANTLQAGGLVAFPTETVYGLGADATRNDSVAQIFATKKRPSFNPLIVHIKSVADAEGLAKLNGTAQKLAETFWRRDKGGLTLVLPKSADCPISELALAGGATIALRVPAHPIALALLEKSGLFLAAPSANPSGRLSPTSAEHVTAHLAVPVLDGGRTQLGLESTIIACLPEGNFLLRAGAIAQEELEATLGAKLAPMKDEGKIKMSAGRLPQHYAPKATLRLNATEPLADEGFLGFGKYKSEFNLSPSGDLTEAAQNFFAHLHQLDERYDKIAVAPIPQKGLGIAINDRLWRAATG